jgi:hypothetical protein
MVAFGVGLFEAMRIAGYSLVILTDGDCWFITSLLVAIVAVVFRYLVWR